MHLPVWITSVAWVLLAVCIAGFIVTICWPVEKSQEAIDETDDL